MNHKEKMCYVEEIVTRYHLANRKQKKIILDEFCLVCHVNRKYAIRLLNKGSVIIKQKPRGRKPTYLKEQLLPHLKKIWLATDMMCGKRLKKALLLWLPHYQRADPGVTPELYNQLLAMSAATLDRMLKLEKHTGKRHGLSGTRPGIFLKNQIEIKTDHWDVTQPGFFEADTVAHCGNSMAGDFAWSLTFVDIYSGWTEIRATWNKGEVGVVDQLTEVESILPFKLSGFDSDNGSEFLNYHLLRYLQERKEPVQFTRSRPYKKNDNAHVEQKNWTGVRHVFGYYRIDKQHQYQTLDAAYS